MFLIFGLVLWSVVIGAFSQAGTECSKDGDCFKYQICKFGSCSCDIGYVQGIKHCFPLRGYGEECFYLQQCEDFRMTCDNLEGDPPTVKRCLCDRYHEWSEDFKECVQSRNLAAIVQNLTEQVNWSEEIEQSGKKVFYGLVVAGIMAVSLGLFFAAVCIVYGCCCRRRKIDSPPPKDRNKVNIQEVASAGANDGTYMVIPTDLSMDV